MVAGFALCAGVVLASAVRAADPVSVSNAWVRTPAPGQKVAGAYMEIVSDGAAAVVGASSPAAARAELHTMSMEAGVMKMRPAQSVDLPPGKTVKLAPGGLHIMLTDLQRPLKAGDKVPLALSIRRGGAITQVNVEAEVRSAAAHLPHLH
jgi:copper(I)-binding protein